MKRIARRFIWRPTRGSRSRRIGGDRPLACAGPPRPTLPVDFSLSWTGSINGTNIEAGSGRSRQRSTGNSRTGNTTHRETEMRTPTPTLEPLTYRRICPTRVGRRPARNCCQRRRFTNRTPSAATAGPEGQVAEADVPVNHTTRYRTSNRASSTRGSIIGRTQLRLIYTRADVGLVPLSAVEGLKFRPCTRFLMAANGTEIKVLGEATVPLRIWYGFPQTTTFSVSD